MQTNMRRLYTAACTLALATVLTPAAWAQPQKQTPPAPAAAASETDVSAIREQLIQLIRMNRDMASFISRDPSLLSNQEYVSRNNPELAKFLAAHPQVAQNPEFYLFASVGPEGRRSHFERQIWPEMRQRDVSNELLTDVLGPFLIFIIILGALLWLLRTLIESRRWNRIFKLQAEVHNKLLDKFGSNEEILAYMGTDAGRRFLEAAPIAVNFEQTPRWGAPLSRVVIPLQLGVVLALVGLGFFILRGQLPEAAAALLVFGTMGLMLGIGFIISAGISWALARHLGLMNPAPTSPGSIGIAEKQA